MYNVSPRRRIALPTINQGTTTAIAIVSGCLGAVAVVYKIWGGSNGTLPVNHFARANWNGSLATGGNNPAQQITGVQNQALNQFEEDAPWAMFYHSPASSGIVLPLPSDRFRLEIVLGAGTNITGATLDYWVIFGSVGQYDAKQGGMPF